MCVCARAWEEGGGRETCYINISVMWSEEMLTIIFEDEFLVWIFEYCDKWK